MPIIRVALNIPINTLFDYYADTATSEDIGYRVCVPLGKKLVIGIVLAVDTASQVPAEKLKSIHSFFRETPPLPASLLDLFLFCSQYYHYPLGRIVLNSLPARFRKNLPLKSTTSSPNPGFRLTATGQQISLESLPRRNLIERELLLQFQQHGILMPADLVRISPRAKHWVKKWVAMEWITPFSQPLNANMVPSSIPQLNQEQAHAVSEIESGLHRFAIWLLHGITGSGKTEVYLRIIATALKHNKQVLVLIPEINLTPQLESIFRTRFSAFSIINLHSGLNDTERLSGWLQAQQGQARIVLGTRLALFTPLPHLGLIIVDEEQDHAFKQQDGLRYSARDMAIFRAKQHNIPVILGSATPSLESFHNALRGRYHHLRLQSRAVQAASLPAIRLIDIRIHKPQEGLSQPLLEALRQCLDQRQQSLVFINRRGYAPVLLCKFCGWTATCQRCSSRLVVHLHNKQLSCHHCGRQENFPHICPQCSNHDIVPFGQGTQRIEKALMAQFPDARILRIDHDSVQRKQAWNNMLEKIHAQEIDILVGTQILAKGHDFPNLSLVCVLNSDASLYSTDFRASEHLFSQLMQVSGRAGRAQISGQVYIQTEFPEHPLYAALQRHDFDTLAHMLLAERKMAGLPPYVFQALLRAEAHEVSKVMNFLTQAAQIADSSCDVEIFDPVPASMSRLKGFERAHLLVQSASRSHLHQFLTKWQVKINTLNDHHRIRWTLEVDPIEF